ncbi:Uncharacterised protein [Zhongshania aliphaticivorans]|uniref:Uncharacterized protein n=1 Tax=Zhongshania aliphaticivorans TaxID=1470434 RepID=A0A5S9PZU3_9GAMM|nr:Uncharacterised protein [Zhongshania aliphaticivorans]CAA0118192.1 Uncharacterised protein [Zhongshania aliphaticivorans]CAA0122205.1 Uncharacterised protein [Zhongshania aliphaticivorans]
MAFTHMQDILDAQRAAYLLDSHTTIAPLDIR